MPLNLYLDECIPPLLSDAILQSDPQRFHIDHALQLARGLSDPEQLKFAVHTAAVLITYNIRDFVWLNRWWKTLHVWELLPTLSPIPHMFAIASIDCEPSSSPLRAASIRPVSTNLAGVTPVSC